MLFKLFLYLHIAAGSLSLILGPVALMVKKGGVAHVRSGLVFYYSMLVVAGCSFVLAVLHPSPFLFAVGVFSGYLNLTGRRYLTQKQAGLANQAGVFERVLAGLMLVFSFYLLVMGVKSLAFSNGFGIVFLLFGGISLGLVWSDYQVIGKRGVAKMFWLRQHIIRMTGTCIATYTAFLVVNMGNSVGVVGWILPTIVGTPLIVYWIRKMKV